MSSYTAMTGESSSRVTCVMDDASVDNEEILIYLRIPNIAYHTILLTFII